VSPTINFPLITIIPTVKSDVLDGFDAFNFYPDEAVVMPTNREMVIDFP
jgi:hypothetical protein